MDKVSVSQHQDRGFEPHTGPENLLYNRAKINKFKLNLKIKMSINFTN